jgi:hypothetical protein
MQRIILLTIILGALLSLSAPAHAWIAYLDGSEDPELIPPWEIFRNEGGLAFEDLGGGNLAVRLDSPDHSGEPEPEPGTYYNEFFVTDIPGYEKVMGARFRLDSFTPTGKENLLSPSTPVSAPSITLVDGRYWLWSFLSDEPNQPVLDLGPAVAGQWHEAYIMCTVLGTDDMGVPNAGGAKLWWDGAVVYDGPMDGGGGVHQGGYAEFGSGTYWQVDAGTVVDFDWVGFGDASDFPAPPINAGDFDENNRVDAADLAAWKEHYGLATGAVHADGDADRDFDVDGADFLLWQQDLGVGGPAPVPEPAAAALFLLALPAARRLRA